jgi:hypothetical protein
MDTFMTGLEVLTDMADSPTSRTLKALRSDGYQAGVCEKWNAHCRIRQDLFGFADVAAIKSDVVGTLFIQACAACDQSKRMRKLLAVPSVRVALESANRVEVWGWRKSAKTNRWVVNRLVVTVADVDAAASQQTQDASGAPAADDEGMIQPEGLAGHL